MTNTGVATSTPAAAKLPVTIDTKGRVRTSREQRRLILAEFERQTDEQYRRWLSRITGRPTTRRAVVKVMREAVEEVVRRGEDIEVKVRDFLKVRLKDVCPRCGSKLRKAGVRGMDAYFCPKCQPATRSGLVDWTKTGR